MRLRIGLLTAVGVTALVPAAPAQAPARAEAEAFVASGDFGDVGRAAAGGDGRETVSDSAARPGMQIAAGRTSARAARDGGVATARAAATARQVSLFDGRVTAARVSRTATARDGAVRYGGSVRGLVVDGLDRGDGARPHSVSSGGLRVIVNRRGEGLRVRLTRAVAGYAAGTTVVVADVSADGADRIAPVATPTPAATATPVPVPSATPEPAPSEPKPTPAQRLARGRYVFPVYGDARVADDFGAARQIGAHEGNDIFAAFGSPVLAVADGTLNRVGTLPISGNRLWLKTARGDAFFYAHLSAFGPEAVSGRKVRAGALLGFVGNTGDAEPTPPHVHFEIHPAARRNAPPSTGTRRDAQRRSTRTRCSPPGRRAASCRRTAGSPATAATPRRVRGRSWRCAISSRESETSDAGVSRAQRMRERLAERRAAHLQRGRLYRILFAIAGALVTLAGIAMLVTPGPAFVVIPIGLAMLALEFAWAERLLDRALEQAEIAQRKAAATTRTQRILGALGGLLAVGAAVTAWLLWEIPLIPG